MTDNRYRRLPVGIQSFKVIREENYLYVDKSDIVWNMVNLGDKYNYLSRPSIRQVCTCRYLGVVS